jgi:hypothetical protein
MHHEPVPERLLVHLRDRYGVDPVAATKLTVHKTYVMYVRTLYLACFGDRRALTNGSTFNEWVTSTHPSTSAPPPLQSWPRSAGRSPVRQGNGGGSVH